MKKLLKFIFVSFNLMLILICAASVYELLQWSPEKYTELPKPIAPRTASIHKPDNFNETDTTNKNTEPQNSSFTRNHLVLDNPAEFNRTESADLVTEINKYPLNLLGDKHSAPGFVVVDDSGTVYTELSGIISALGWTMLKDGTVFSDKQLTNNIMKIELNHLPNYTISFKGRSFKLQHPVLETNGSVLVPLSDLKDLWILDFSIDPASKSLSLSCSP